MAPLRYDASMARTKEFDSDQALEDALRVFWEKGYEATSVQDLVDAMGVSRSSLYQSFGSKHDLFLKVLDRFARSDRNLETATAGMEPGLARIRAALRLAGEQTATDTRGCLMVNAIVEQGGLDSEIQAISQATRLHLETFFAHSLADAERRGEISPGRDHVALARFLTNALFGLRVTAKTASDPEVIRSIVDTTLRCIE